MGEHPVGFEAWRLEARRLLAHGVAPERVAWSAAGTHGVRVDGPATTSVPSLPARLLPRARRVSAHASPGRWDVLYRVAWAASHGSVDARSPEGRELARLDREVQADMAATLSSLRFRPLRGISPPHGVAWARPVHSVLPLVAADILRNCDDSAWTVLTEGASASWDGSRLRFGPGTGEPVAPARLEAAWRAHAARWFPTLLGRDPPERHERITSADDFVPVAPTLPRLREAAATCTGCELHRGATQVVFGEGAAKARAVVVGEQPGDEEDRAGAPFVGPAGRLLDEVLEEAGVDRASLYVTNAVKHFKFTLSGKRRLHAKPTAREVRACLPWLVAEIEALRPEAVVCLGATAAAAVLGPSFRVTRQRGRPLATPWAPWVMATWHPSAVLRMPDRDRRHAARAEMVGDFRHLAEHLGAG